MTNWAGSWLPMIHEPRLNPRKTRQFMLLFFSNLCAKVREPNTSTPLAIHLPLSRCSRYLPTLVLLPPPLSSETAAQLPFQKESCATFSVHVLAYQLKGIGMCRDNRPAPGSEAEPLSLKMVAEEELEAVVGQGKEVTGAVGRGWGQGPYKYIFPRR